MKGVISHFDSFQIHFFQGFSFFLESYFSKLFNVIVRLEKLLNNLLQEILR